VAEVRDRFPGAAVLVEEMVAHGGIELIVGAFLDPELGPCVMVGAGGILAELQQDVAFRLLPCTRTDAQQMIDELVIAPVFWGYRGIGVSGATVRVWWMRLSGSDASLLISDRTSVNWISIRWSAPMPG